MNYIRRTNTNAGRGQPRGLCPKCNKRGLGPMKVIAGRVGQDCRYCSRTIWTPRPVKCDAGLGLTVRPIRVNAETVPGSDMKTSNIKGHCQACGRVQVVLPTYVMSNHGYKVRSGYFSGVCAGHDHLPLEQERSYLDWIVTDLETFATMHDVRAVQLRNGEHVPAKVMKRDEWKNPVYGERDARTYMRPVVMIPFGEANPAEREMQIALDIGTSESESRFARGHAKSLLALAAKVYGTKLIDRTADEMAKREKSAAKKAPIVGAFRTKAAQKDALEALNRKFSQQRDIIQNHYLSLPARAHGDPGEEVYYTLPHDLHNWRARHGALVLALYPQFASLVREIDSLAVERAEIKAMPVIK